MTYTSTVVFLDGQIYLRIYIAGRLEIEIPLPRRRALLLASDLLNALLLPEIAAAENAPVLDQAIQSRVADHHEHAREYGQ